jgi:RNA polymerase sigma-70 factor, ECF subfamily
MPTMASADPQTHRDHLSVGEVVEAWIRRHQAPTWRFLRMCGCPADTADDLLQDTLLAALQKRVHEQGDAIAAAWLRGAAGNLWRMHLRGQARRSAWHARAVAERALGQETTGDGGEAWLVALRQCLQQVDGRTREVLDRHYRARDPRDAIAAAMGLRPEGVKTLLRRVREVLRECVLRRLAAGSELRT